MRTICTQKSVIRENVVVDVDAAVSRIQQTEENKTNERCQV